MQALAVQASAAPVLRLAAFACTRPVFAVHVLMAKSAPPAGLARTAARPASLLPQRHSALFFIYSSTSVTVQPHLHSDMLAQY